MLTVAPHAGAVLMHAPFATAATEASTSLRLPRDNLLRKRRGQTASSTIPRWAPRVPVEAGTGKAEGNDIAPENGCDRARKIPQRFTMSTLEGLLARREQLRADLVRVEVDIQAAQAARRNEAISKVKELMTQFGLTVADLAIRRQQHASATKVRLMSGA